MSSSRERNPAAGGGRRALGTAGPHPPARGTGRLCRLPSLFPPRHARRFGGPRPLLALTHRAGWPARRPGVRARCHARTRPGDQHSGADCGRPAGRRRTSLVGWTPTLPVPRRFWQGKRRATGVREHAAGARAPYPRRPSPLFLLHTSTVAAGPCAVSHSPAESAQCSHWRSPWPRRMARGCARARPPRVRPPLPDSHTRLV